MICSSTDDVVLCSTRSAAADVAMPSRTVRESSTMEREETQAMGALVNTGVITEESTRRYDVKLDDVLSVRSSIVSNASVGDLKREQLTTTSRMPAPNASSPSSHDSAAAAGPRSKTRLEEKIRMIAHYIKSMSMGFKHRHPSTASDAYANSISSSGSRRQRTGKKSKKDMQSTTRVTKRRSQVSLSQYSQPRSTPDVLEDQKPTKSRANDVSNNSSNMTARCSNSSEQTSLSWEEICVGAVLVEENEVMPASPRSRKRGRRAIELFEELELRRLCGRCDVPPSNVAEVVKMVLAHFGTCHFDVTVFHELVGGNSVVVIGMLVFMCIDSNEEFLDLHRLPLFLHYLQTRYNERNPFHNACHAADVLHSLFTMMWCTELCSRVAVHNQIGVLFAAIMHDIEHIGLTNDFLLKTNHEIAIKFPTRAPMEEMHLTVALEVLADPKFHVLSKMSNDQQDQVLGIVRDTIRSTALCYQKDMLCDIAEVSTDEWAKHDAESVLPLKLQTLALRIAMHVSDISQTMKPFFIHNKWVNRLNEELFLQGDLDQQMSYSACPESCFRDKWTEEAFLNSQVWFLRNLALPAAKGFNSIPWLQATFLEDNLHANISTWEAQLAAITIPKA